MKFIDLLLGVLVCVLQIDRCRFALGVNYMATGITEEESTAYMDATGRMFLITTD